jgi:aspartate aminotransferase-like enzyme/ribosomal protein S18 acetylase RimI-like enzyme
MPRTLSYKIADTPMEYEAIHLLNHRTFVEEIPQHHADPQGRLVDRFHTQNTYAVCLDEGTVVGMVAGRSARPFSLDEKLGDLDRHLPAGRKPVEIRLLAVDPRYRSSAVTARLLAMIAGHFADLGCDLAVISGTTRALEMYRRMGFVPFGPLTGAPGAQFQPMYLTASDAQRSRWAGFGSGGPSAPVNFLPGPVEVAPQVLAAFAAPPAYHRSAEYLAVIQELHARLAGFVNAAGAQILLGSGTLANDVVASQLKLLGRPGLILANGEFGERLVDHAARTGLDFTVLSAAWGSPLHWHDIEAGVGRLGAGGWLWATHCETSTGTLIDLGRLSRLCAAAGVKLCVDAISSIGTVPLDLASVYLATGASGKALGSFPGLSMVFYQRPPRPAPQAIPRYLDLGSYVDAEGIAFTQSSNLVRALEAALSGNDWPDRYARLARASGWLHARLRRLGFLVVAPAEVAAPGVCTVALPAGVDAELVGSRMEAEGYLVAFQSSYLRQRNWLQVSLMGRWTWPSLRALPTALAAAMPDSAAPLAHDGPQPRPASVMR